MRLPVLLSIAALLLAAAPAYAQSDDELPVDFGPKAKVIDVRETEAYTDAPERAYDDEYEQMRRRRRHTGPEPKELTRRMGLLDEAGYGVGAELVGGLALIHQGLGAVPRFTGGLNVAWQLGRMFSPENELLFRGLYLEGSYLFASTDEGTDAVKVPNTYHTLSASLLAGYPFPYVLVYGKLGPAMFIESADYQIQGKSTEFTGVRAGLVYGVGARFCRYYNDSFGLVTRLELLRTRRWYMDDTLFLAGIGMAF